MLEQTSRQGTSEFADQAIKTLAGQLERGELKASAADFVRLLQFRNESPGAPHQAMTVRWVDECQKTTSEE